MRRLRRPGEDLLANRNRRAVFERVQADPAVGARGIAAATGLAPTTVRHHLRVLRRAGWVVERRQGGALRYFEAGAAWNRDWTALALLRDSDLSRLHDWLVEHPGCIQKEILDHSMDAWGWGRSTAQHRLRRLVEGGLVQIEEAGAERLHTAERPR